MRRRRRSSAAATIRSWNGRCARVLRGSPACRRAARPGCGGSHAVRSLRPRFTCTASTAMTRSQTAMPSPVQSGLHDAVVIAVARREQGLVVAAGNALQLSDVASIAAQRARLALRPQGAGAQLLLLALVARAGFALDALASVRPVCPTGADIAQAVRAGRADCGIATRAVAQAAGLDFVPLAWERFDLALRQRDYFLPGLQALFNFVRTATFRERASELSGYDVSEAGNVRWVN